MSFSYGRGASSWREYVERRTEEKPFAGNGDEAMFQPSPRPVPTYDQYTESWGSKPKKVSRARPKPEDGYFIIAGACIHPAKWHRRKKGKDREGITLYGQKSPLRQLRGQCTKIDCHQVSLITAMLMQSHRYPWVSLARRNP